MIVLTTTRRRIGRDVARASAVLAAVMLVVGLGSSHHATAAATNGGALQILTPPGPTGGQPLTSGGSGTGFALTPPVGAACSGDSVSGGFRVQSFMVPASVDPASLTFNASGPIPQGTGANLRAPLVSDTGNPFVNVTTALTSGLLINLPVFSFGWLGANGPTFVPPGTYTIGYACTKGLPGATQLDKYWTAQLTFAVDPTDSPSGVTWTIAATPVPPSSSSTTSTSTTTSTTSTTLPRATSTTSTSSTSSTSSTIQATSSTTGSQSLVASSSGSGSSTGTTTLSVTGSSPLPIVVWAILLLVFGRLAILLGRPLKVLPPKER